jgi:NAD-dependent dihydropyrimidine dehydrogenase PreA subunit
MDSYGTWKGFPREQIPWYPRVDLGKCLGCRTCVEFCSHGVYGWDEPANRPKVIEPFRCVVGCSGCSSQCDEGAITFPPLSILKQYVGAP